MPSKRIVYVECVEYLIDQDPGACAGGTGG